MQYQERLTQMIAELAEQERVESAKQAQLAEQFSPAKQAELQRLHALRECLEAALLCDKGNDAVAKQKVRAATSLVDGWHELVKQAKRK